MWNCCSIKRIPRRNKPPIRVFPSKQHRKHEGAVESTEFGQPFDEGQRTKSETSTHPESRDVGSDPIIFSHEDEQTNSRQVAVCHTHIMSHGTKESDTNSPHNVLTNEENGSCEIVQTISDPTNKQFSRYVDRFCSGP